MSALTLFISGIAAIPRLRHSIARRIAALVVLCTAAIVPAGIEAHGGIYHYAERSTPGGISVIVLVTGLIVGLAFLSTAFTIAGVRRSLLRRLLAAAAGVVIMAMPISVVAWNFAASDDDGLIIMQQFDELLATSYSGEYGGLITPHHFGQGKTAHNPPDILEAGGYMVDLRYAPDSQNVDSFTIQTLRGKRFEFLVRPEIVPVNWSPWALQVYRNCNCMVAVHFTEQDVGKVAIVLFEVSSEMTD